MNRLSSNKIFFAVLILFMTISIVECSDRSSHRHRSGQSQEEKDKERYYKPFVIIGGAIFLSIAPILGRFVYSIVTDPLVPLLLVEVNKRGKEMIVYRFGTLGQPDTQHDRAGHKQKVTE
jgi:ABC-type Fe3+ transport system permease subunit